MIATEFLQLLALVLHVVSGQDWHYAVFHGVRMVCVFSQAHGQVYANDCFN